MAKALKIAALVAGGAALAITGVGIAAGLSLAAATSFGVAGVSASALFLASGALSAAAGALTKAPDITGSQTDRLHATIDPRAFRKEVLGSTAMATDVRYEEWHGANQDYCSWIICVASHAIESIDEIWLNDELAWTTAGGTQGKFAGYFLVPHLTLEAQASDGYTFGSGRWNGDRRLTGCAWLHLQFKVTGNSKKAESPFSGGPTNRMTIIGKGARLYDPSRDSTVPGGSGPMRANDQSTWRYVTDDGEVIGENLPLQILRRLLGWRIRNPVTGEMKLALGSGIPAKRIDVMSFMVAARLAEEPVIRSAGGTEPRYQGAGVISEGDDPKTVLDMLCAGCCGRFRDTGGRLSLVIAHNDLAEGAIDDGLNEDDVIGDFTFDPDPSLEATPNIVRGRYVDPSPASLYQLIDYPEIRIPSIDGIDRVFPLDLGVVESPSQAQRIGKQVLQRKQLTRSFKAPFDERAWRWPVGSVVPFTFAPLGFVRQLCRVASQDICDEGPNRGACIMELSLEYQEIYAWDGSDKAPVRAIAAPSYNPALDPLAQAINQAVTPIEQLLIASSYTVGATISAADASGSATATISDHSRVYQDRTVAVTGSTIGVLTSSTTYLFYYDDAARAGGAVTIIATTDGAEAFPSSTAPARHYVGSVTTPAPGGGPSDGGGSSPPGGGEPIRYPEERLP